jgi:hypothetical protein
MSSMGQRASEEIHRVGKHALSYMTENLTYYGKLSDVTTFFAL